MPQTGQSGATLQPHSVGAAKPSISLGSRRFPPSPHPVVCCVHHPPGPVPSIFSLLVCGEATEPPRSLRQFLPMPFAEGPSPPVCKKYCGRLVTELCRPGTRVRHQPERTGLMRRFPSRVFLVQSRSLHLLLPRPCRLASKRTAPHGQLPGSGEHGLSCELARWLCRAQAARCQPSPGTTIAARRSL